MVSASVIGVNTWITTHLLTPKERRAEYQFIDGISMNTEYLVAYQSRLSIDNVVNAISELCVVTYTYLLSYKRLWRFFLKPINYMGQ